MAGNGKNQTMEVDADKDVGIWTLFPFSKGHTRTEFDTNEELPECPLCRALLIQGQEI